MTAMRMLVVMLGLALAECGGSGESGSGGQTSTAADPCPTWIPQGGSRATWPDPNCRETTDPNNVCGAKIAPQLIVCCCTDPMNNWSFPLVRPMK